MCLQATTLTVLWPRGSAVEIQPVFLLLVRGVVLLIRVWFKYDLSLDPWALMRGEGIRLGAEWLMSGGCSCLIRRLTVQAGEDLWVKKSLPHLPVLPGCCLPHHLQLLLYFPKGGEKTRMWCHSNASQCLCRSFQHTRHTRVLIIECSDIYWIWRYIDILKLDHRGTIDEGQTVRHSSTDPEEATTSAERVEGRIISKQRSSRSVMEMVQI